MNLNSLKSFLTNFNTPDGKLDYHKITFPVISVLVSLIVLFTVVVPQAFELTHNQNDLDNLQTQINNLNAKINALNNISANDAQSNLTTVNQALPISKDYIDSTIYIQDALDKTHLTLSGLTFSEFPLTGNIESYRVKIELEGDLAAINQFMSLIDRSPRILKVAKVELNSASNQKNYNVTLTISAFYSALKKPNLTPASPVVSLTETELEQIFQLEKSFKSYPSKSLNNQVGRADPFI